MFHLWQRWVGPQRELVSEIETTNLQTPSNEGISVIRTFQLERASGCSCEGDIKFSYPLSLLEKPESLTIASESYRAIPFTSNTSVSHGKPTEPNRTELFCFPLSDAMDEEVRKIFNKFDKNGDGKISSTELKELMAALGSKTTSEEVRRMMAELDQNGDGYIDLKEFGDFHCAGGDSRELREAFELYDLDKNGLISAKELHSVMRRLGEKCSLSDCRKMIGKVDADGDGNVNFEEFKKMMTRS
ncbi:hypothetical protein VNO77_43622 [Canavalia gladiata]|uniref:EF-hand domain-containing protein n=1 Tax=Canavalia gladiata TaxID=3824 RepID=A0AAN9JV54_CANGL